MSVLKKEIGHNFMYLNTTGDVGKRLSPEKILHSWDAPIKVY
jgi:hypothetical protein